MAAVSAGGARGLARLEALCDRFLSHDSDRPSPGLAVDGLCRAQGPAELEGRVQAADVSSMKAGELRQRRRLFLLALVGDLIGVAVVLTLGLEAWLVAIIAVGLMLPTLSMLAWMTARIRSAEAYSTEAERLGHHELVPDRDRRQ